MEEKKGTITETICAIIAAGCMIYGYVVLANKVLDWVVDFAFGVFGAIKAPKTESIEEAADE